MMIYIGIALIFIMVNFYLEKKYNNYLYYLNFFIALSPVIIVNHSISTNFSLLLTTILVLNISKRISFCQSLLMIIGLSLTQVGLDWNDAILLVFVSSYFDKLSVLGGRDKLLMLVGGFSIYLGYEALALIFILLNSLNSKSENFEVSLLPIILILSSYTFFEIDMSLINIILGLYLLFFVFLTSSNNLINITTGFFIISFLAFRFEHAISYIYLILFFSVLLGATNRLFQNKKIIEWLTFCPKANDLTMVISFIAMSYAWTNILIYIFTFLILLKFCLSRFSKVDLKDKVEQKSLLINIGFYLIAFQPMSDGPNIFGFRRIVGFSLAGETSYIPHLFIMIGFLVVALVYYKFDVVRLVRNYIFKYDLKNEYRLSFFASRIEKILSGSEMVKIRDVKQKHNDIRWVFGSSALSSTILVVYVLAIILYLTIRAVIDL